jgi:hypothetical protein
LALLRRSVDGSLGWVIIACLSIILLICIVWFFPNSDKGHYKNYKRYEVRIDTSLKKTIDEVEKHKKTYYTNNLSKRQMILYLEHGADELGKLYDSFKWKKGDEVTKELFILKKQIIINYAQAYRNKAESLDKEIYYNETEDMNYIATIIDRYKTKDKLEKEKFNIDF